MAQLLVCNGAMLLVRAGDVASGPAPHQSHVHRSVANIEDFVADTSITPFGIVHLPVPIRRGCLRRRSRPGDSQ